MKKENGRLLRTCLLLILLAVLMAACSSASAESGKWGTLSWSLNSTGTLTVSGSGAMNNLDGYADAWLPYRDSIRKAVIGSGITSVGDYAFQEFPNLKSVSLPDTLKRIGKYAFSGCSEMPDITIPGSVTALDEGAFFNCNGLTSVKVPNSVTSIGEYAFCACYGLKSVTLPKNLKAIEKETFSSCELLSSVNIPSGVTRIGNQAFIACASLASVTLPDKLESIGTEAFRDCDLLTGVAIPDSVTSIGTAAFASCDNLESFSVGSGSKSFCSAGGVLFNKNKTTILAYPPAKAGASYTIPSGVTKISAYAFFGSASLNTVKIAASVTAIGRNAFTDSSLSSVTIPKGVTSIGAEPFKGCWNLTSISVESGSTAYTSAAGVLFNKSKTTLIAYPVGSTKTSYKVPDGVTKIGSSAMAELPNLEKVTIPGSVKEIGSSAFISCGNLTDVSLSGGLETIGSWAFSGCFSLEAVSLPCSVKKIGTDAFSWCDNLTRVVIPESVNSIGADVFEYSPVVTVYVFANSPALTYVKKHKITYRTMKVLTVPKDLTVLRESVFDGSGCEAVIIQEGCKTIGHLAFANCPNLVYVRIPASVTSRAGDAFYNSGKPYLDILK